MGEYEAELEKDKELLEKQLQQAENKADVATTRVHRLEDDKKQLRKELQQAENQVDKLQEELQKTIDKGMLNAKKVVSLEIENEEFQNEARHLGYIINDLELKFDTQLEEIELLQNELEEQKLHSEEQIERQK